MKRAAAFLLLAFWMWSVAPAGANSVPSIAIDCDSVDITWIDFPDHPVDLTVTVSEGDEQTVASLSTEGQPAGEGSVPVQLHTGTASATVEWTLQNPHSAGPVTAELHCTPSPSTTEPSTTTSSSTTSTVPDSTTVPDVPTTAPVACGDNTLACTGSSGSPWALGVGGYLVALGAVFMALHPRKVAP